MKPTIPILLLCIALIGCGVSEEQVENINTMIEARYSSFSTMQYTVEETHYKDGTKSSESQHTEMWKRPDKLRQVFADEGPTDSLDGRFYVCNGNIAYSRAYLDTIREYEYYNLPAGMTSYCSRAIDERSERWKIPSEITDESKYDVEVSMEDAAVKAVVTVLMSEEAKEKQRAKGNEPKETVITYWFKPYTFEIIKTEAVSTATQCEGATATVGGSSTEGDCETFEMKTVAVYENFVFDEPIDNSEFEVDPSEYPDVDYRKERVNFQEKMDG